MRPQAKESGFEAKEFSVSDTENRAKNKRDLKSHNNNNRRLVTLEITWDSKKLQTFLKRKNENSMPRNIITGQHGASYTDKK